MHKRLFLSVFIPLLFAVPAFAQQEFSQKDRAIYILDIARYVRWENLEEIKEFKVGVLDQDKQLFETLQLLATERKELHKKPIRVLHFKSLAEIADVQVIYLHKQSGFDIELVLNKTRGKHTLLISESYPYHKSMINFIVVNNIKQYELNQKLLNVEGLSVGELFKASAITQQADWEKLYDQTELELEKEKITVLKQKSEIEEQRKEIEIQATLIKAQRIEIERQIAALEQLEQEINEKQRILEVKSLQVFVQEKELKRQSTEIANQALEVQKQKKILQQQLSEISAQQAKIDTQKLVLDKQLEKIEKQQLVLYFFVVMLFLISVLGYFIYRSYIIKKRANIALEEKNRKITAQKEEIEIQRDNITEQRDRIALQKKQITDSIYYAQRIQRAILPDYEDFRKALDNFFILFKPKDIVSGDFFWESHVGDDIVVVAADCTGHGVPGAFMSMLGMTLLNDIVNRQRIVQPGEILNRLRDYIVKSLNQSDETSLVRDGMDVAVCTLNRKTGKIQFAGANNPMFLVRNKELILFKGDKMPVAIYDNMVSFTNQELELLPGDAIYIFSDGYIDQFGGENGKKFLRKRLVDVLLTMENKTMSQQRDELDQTFELWKGNQEQIDDVLIIGIRV